MLIQDHDSSLIPAQKYVSNLLEIWSQLLNKPLIEKFIFCAVYAFSYCHKRSFRESTLGFLFLFVSMARVVCFILSCQTDEGDSLQHDYSNIKNTCKDGGALGWNHLTSYMDINIERKD